jgi:hypothetical protein
MTCPQCGAPLNIDVLTREPRPCKECGATYSLNSEERPQPEPEHQQSINRQKYFEIAAVIIMIIVGFGYLALSINARESAGTGVSGTAADMPSILAKQGYKDEGTTTILDQRFDTFTQQSGILRTTVDLMSLGTEANSEINAFIIAVGLPPNQPLPPDEVIAPAVQEAFNSVTQLSEALLPHSTPGFEKAVATTAPIQLNTVYHLKGVAQTSSGWKITYINYRAYEENEHGIPLMLFIYERLNTASDTELEDFHLALYKAINTGIDIKTSMQE